MSIKERIKGFFIGFALAVAGLQITFDTWILSLILGLPFGVFFIKAYKKYLLLKMRDTLLIQFKDFLEAISSSYGSGRNTVLAFKDSFRDMRDLYGDNAYITKELFIICNGLVNGQKIDKMLGDFSIRSSLEDVETFYNIFKITSVSGGNLKDIINRARDIINEKIDVELEIKTTIAQKKLELYIMLVMPFLVILALRTMGDNTFFEMTAVNVITKIFVIVSIVVSYFIGKKIVDIKV